MRRLAEARVDEKTAGSISILIAPALQGGMDALGVPEYLLVAAVAFAASILGGVTGYGTGLLLPPVLVPLIGAEAVVPVISVSSLISNTSRLLAFRADLDPRRAILVVAAALPTCILGAYAYTLLSGPGVSILIGIVLIVAVPLRRAVGKAGKRLSDRGLTGAAAAYGLLSGGTAGTGIVLLAILLAAGLHGPAVIATDAAASLVIGVAKAAVFQTAGYLPLRSWAVAILIGLAAIPGAFIARRLTYRLTTGAHIAVLDAVVIGGGALLIVQGLRG
jgi:uncharacterized membrane protein YfcA